MLTVGNLKERQGIRWTARGGVDVYAVIVHKHDDAVEAAYVFPLKDGDKCYDDGDAVKERHADNVRLSSYPPFMKLRLYSADRECFVRADLDDLVRLDDAKLERLGVELVDGGRLISEYDMKEILDHPWRDTPEKEAPGGRGFAIGADAGSESDEELEPVDVFGPNRRGWSYADQANRKWNEENEKRKQANAQRKSEAEADAVPIDRHKPQLHIDEKDGSSEDRDVTD